MTFPLHALRAAVWLALGAALLPAHATDGYFPHGFGIKAKGMGGASTALAQDGFAGANNPAAAAFAGNRLEAGLDFFMPDRAMSRTGTGGMLDVSVRSDKRLFYIPEFGYNVALSRDLGVGITVFGNGGMNTTYPGGQLTCPMPGGGVMPGANALCGMGNLGVDLSQLIVAPTVAYRVNENHSFGISPLFVFQQFSAYGLEGFSAMSAAPTKLTGNGHDESTGFGVRLGYMGKLSDKVTIGVSYSPKINMTRFDDYAGLFADGGDFDIPENYTLGVAFNATKDFMVAVDYQGIRYGSVPAIGNAATTGPLGGSPGGGFGWRNVGVWKVGAQWQMGPQWVLRAGYARGENPVTSANITPNILAPGVIKSQYTLGATYALSPASELTFAFMYAPRVSMSGPSMLAGTETVSMKQRSLAVQWGMKF